MTDELISLQSAVDVLARVAREKFNLSDDFNHYLAGLMDGEKAIRELPESVIRCKDCKHKYIEDGVWNCPFGLAGGEMFYCGYGSLGVVEGVEDLMVSGEMEDISLPSAQPDPRSFSCGQENDMISRRAAIDAFDGVKVDEENCTEYDIGYNDGIDFAVSRLSVLPSAQPEIIHCMDCDWWTKQDDSIQGRCALMGAYPTGWWFCGNARRRTDEQTD